MKKIPTHTRADLKDLNANHSGSLKKERKKERNLSWRQTWNLGFLCCLDIPKDTFC